MAVAHGRREPVSSRRDGSRSIVPDNSRTVVGDGRRCTTVPSVSISTSPNPRGRSARRSGPFAAGSVSVSTTTRRSVSVSMPVLDHLHLLREARVRARVGEDDERPRDPEQLVEIDVLRRSAARLEIAGLHGDDRRLDLRMRGQRREQRGGEDKGQARLGHGHLLLRKT